MNPMAKIKHLCAAISFLTVSVTAVCQSYTLIFKGADNDTSKFQKIGLQRSFKTKAEASIYVLKLPSLLQSSGYITASVDSARYDSATGSVVLYTGDQYKWATLHVDPEAREIMDAIHWPERSMSGLVNFETFKLWQQRALDYLEEMGHPFGKSYLDNISIDGDEVRATLKIDKGPEYKIDSLRVYGDAKVTNEFLQHYLDLPNGSLYNKRKLKNISRKIAELTYVHEQRPSDLTLLGTGSVLNLYLKNKKTSQINALIGFQPNNDPITGKQKLLLTVDANILLKNAFGSGETIALLWQQLQQSSPRLNLLFERPYVFHSPFGISFSLDMYKQDSTFLNIDMNLGTTYQIEETKTATVFVQRRQTIVSGINTAYILQTHQLPKEADVSSLNLGVGYNYINTDYRYNPKKGNEFSIIASAGTKKIKKNSQIENLEDPGGPGFNFDHLYDTVKLSAYQFRIVNSAAHYLPLGGQSTLVIAEHSGIYQSASYYRNELFRIGGYKLLRGFDEESQYVSQYAIGTLEYRYRIGLNSYFFAFGDGGWGKHVLDNTPNHTYLGTGLGLSFETKAGLINLAWAVGKRDDTPFNLRQSKVHIGFASFF